MKPTSAMGEKRHELLADIAAHVAQVLLEHKIDTELADQIGTSVSNHLSEAWAGSTITIPKDHLFKLSKRDLEFLSKFNGRNNRRLGLEYGLTVHAIYWLLICIQVRSFDHKQIKIQL